MGTFRTRKQKLMPPGIDSFGEQYLHYCLHIHSIFSTICNLSNSLIICLLFNGIVLRSSLFISICTAGFCTWDAFYSSVDSDKVSSGLDSLSDAGVTVKYVILDDGWQSTALSSKKKDVDEKEKVTNKKSKVLPQLPVISSALQMDTPLQDSKKEVAAAAMTMSASAIVVDREGEDGELSGAQIDGNLAAQKMLEKESSVIVQFFTQAVSNFYTKYVEQGAPDSWPVKLWAGLSQNTILKEKLIEFFDSQTDFSKRLTSWKANSKFENPAKGKTLKGFVKNLKERKGIDYVFVWHALSGYWGGVSTDLSDDLTSALSANRNSASLLSTLSSYPKSTDPARSSINIAAGAIIGGSVGQQSKDPISADKSKAWFTRLRNFRSKVGLAFRPENIQESLQESLPSSAFKDGLLQLSQRILSLTNTSDTAEAVKRSYSRPTPHLLLVEPALAWDPSALVGVGSVAPNKLEEMYERMHSYLADAGIDGVKVDAQSGIGAFGVGNGGGSTIAQACVRAVENSAKRAFSAGNRLKFSEKNALFNLQLQQRVGTLGSIVRRARGLLGLSAQKRAQEVDQGGLLKDSPLALTGCMCHSTENLLNYYETSMARASDDFYPKDMAAQTVHLVSCAYNTVMLGEIATTDWDMFHSKHPFAGMHAAARAISGGPVYVSDSPGNHDPKLLARLVLPDGGILRAQIPARPTIDCLFSDVQKDGATAMKLWSLNKVGAVAGVFNVQGSSWDRKQRRYVQYTPSMMLPVLTAELRPRDIGGPFSALLDTSDESADGTARVLSQDGKSMLEMFAAWSSKEKKMTILKSRNDAIKFEVQPKGWDVVSLSRILVVPGTQAKMQKIRPITQLKNLFGRILPTRKSSKSSVTSSEGTVESGINASSDVIDYGNAVYWSPIGLLDMLNTGGAVERILPSRSSRSASFLAKGPGRFGVFSSQRPKQVTIDGTVCEFSYEAVSRENNKQSIILNDGRGRGINIRLNINAEEMMKEFMQKMGEVSDDVQTFINEASNEYADLMGSMKASDDRSSVQGGLITLLIKSEEVPSSSSPSPPTRLNPLSGVRKIAILW